MILEIMVTVLGIYFVVGSVFGWVGVRGIGMVNREMGMDIDRKKTRGIVVYIVIFWPLVILGIMGDRMRNE